MAIIFTETVLKQAFPKMSDETAKMVVTAIRPAIAKYDLSTINRLAAFVAQTAHESGMFHYKAENLNYSAAALHKVFGKYFPTQALAESYARKPEKIANRVYANRMGNGDEASGDGWTYRGRGWLQITGFSNVSNFAFSLGKPIAEAVAYLDTDEGGFMGAGWFWEKNHLNDIADKNDIVTISKRINGGTNGLEERKSYYSAMQRALAEANRPRPETKCNLK